jgi:hypothetical protein
MGHGNDPGEWNPGHCENSRCLYPRGHDGVCSHEEPRSRPRPSYSQSIYPECRTNDCALYANHVGPCETNTCEVCLQCAEYTEYCGELIDNDQSDSSMDAFHCYSVYLDDVSHELFEIRSDIFSDIPVPKAYKETQISELRERWNESMRAEWEALLKNETFEFVSREDKRVRHRKPTKSRWVYTIKYNRDGTIERFKSRFVVCGYSQKQDVDYDRAFSATLRATSFRTLLAIASGKGMRLGQIDVSNAFTQAQMDDHDVYVEPPLGPFGEYETIRGVQVKKLLKLRRALYGTKQASRLWQNTLREYLISYGFECSTADPCLYRYNVEDGEILLGVYVDDIIVAYKGNACYQRFSDAFFKRFPGKSSKLSWFLGMAIDQHDDYSIHVDHSLSIQKMADKFIPSNKVTREFPSSDLFNKLDRAKNDVERAKIQNFGYASIVGALLYVSVMSRPDIAFHTSILAKFLADPSPECCDAAIVLLQYLHSTRNKRMHYSGKIEVPEGLEKFRPDIIRNHGFVAYSDSSWGNKYPYPMFGYGIYLYGGLISFASKQLKTVAHSSCEAEYAAASYASKEVEFVRNICRDLGVQLKDRLVVSVDNTAAIDIAHDVGVSGRTKHFDRAIHYFRDLTQLRRIIPAFVNTHQQRADGYTKALDKSTFLKWIQNILH